MKFEEQLLDALGEVGMDLVDMAENFRLPKSFLRKTLPVAACAALMVGAGLYAWDYVQTPVAGPAAYGHAQPSSDVTYSLRETAAPVLLASQSSQCDMEDAKSRNVDLACQAINGCVLAPGEEFSFNAALGERTEEKGYVAASAYDSQEPGEIGGGIGQVASMLYCASLKLDLEQLERAGNTYAVDYVPLGFDAAVYWDVTDYRFCNSLDSSVEIRARLENGQVIVELWGPAEEARKIELESVTLAENVVETYQVFLDESGTVLQEKSIGITRYEERE